MSSSKVPFVRLESNPFGKSQQITLDGNAFIRAGRRARTTRTAKMVDVFGDNTSQNQTILEGPPQTQSRSMSGNTTGRGFGSRPRQLVQKNMPRTSKKKQNDQRLIRELRGLADSKFRESETKTEPANKDQMPPQQKTPQQKTQIQQSANRRKKTTAASPQAQQKAQPQQRSKQQNKRRDVENDQLQYVTRRQYSNDRKSSCKECKRRLIKCEASRSALKDQLERMMENRDSSGRAVSPAAAIESRTFAPVAPAAGGVWDRQINAKLKATEKELAAKEKDLAAKEKETSKLRNDLQRARRRADDAERLAFDIQRESSLFGGKNSKGALLKGSGAFKIVDGEKDELLKIRLEEAKRKNQQLEKELKRETQERRKLQNRPMPKENSAAPTQLPQSRREMELRKELERYKNMVEVAERKERGRVVEQQKSRTRKSEQQRQQVTKELRQCAEELQSLRTHVKSSDEKVNSLKKHIRDARSQRVEYGHSMVEWLRDMNKILRDFEDCAAADKNDGSASSAVVAAQRKMDELRRATKEMQK